ncbi:hypothetical protein DEI83_00970 [Curtobacterium sp. MCBD17_021]|nr:hypothetical protein DEI83_00970 [Curtobacterium sp. MCBD17_021]
MWEDRCRWPPGRREGCNVSDQNDRSTPDETPDQVSDQTSGQASAATPADPDRAHQPVTRDPFASSGQGSAAQGVTDPVGDRSGGASSPGQQSPYATPGQYGSAGQYGAAGQYGQATSGRSGQYGTPTSWGSQDPYGQQSGQSAYPQPGAYAQQGQYGSQKPSSNQQQYGQQQYGQQGAAAYNPYAATSQNPYGQPRRTSALAILSIVFAFGGLVFGPLTVLTSPAGAIMGHIALGRIRQTGEQGRGLALAGVIGGWILTAISLLGVILFISFVVFASQNPGSGGYGYDGYDGYDTSGASALIA